LSLDEARLVWAEIEECDHEWDVNTRLNSPGGPPGESALVRATAMSIQRFEVKEAFCRNCGAWRGQMGLEPHPLLFVSHLFDVCREIKRILKPTGTFWLNMGDTYCGGGKRKPPQTKWKSNLQTLRDPPQADLEMDGRWLQQKQLMGMPERVMISLQEDGWILRNKICWHKVNHMPSSTKDRFTPSYEIIYLFAKRPRYFFDLDPIREPFAHGTMLRISQPNIANQPGGMKTLLLRGEEPESGNANRPISVARSLQTTKGKNPGDVWSIPTSPFPDAHFSTFPPRLIEPIVKCAVPEFVCNKCGTPRTKIWKTTPPEGGYKGTRNVGDRKDGYMTRIGTTNIRATYEFVGWTDCECGEGFSPGLLFDPFAGSGTALRVARGLGRRFLGIELVPEFAEMAMRRVRGKKYKPLPEGVMPLSKTVCSKCGWNLRPVIKRSTVETRPGEQTKFGEEDLDLRGPNARARLVSQTSITWVCDNCGWKSE